MESRRQKAVKRPPKEALERKIDKRIQTEQQEKRMQNMKRDMERYALIDFKIEADFVEFRLVNMNDGKSLYIRLKEKTIVSCSCIDFKIRCKKNDVNCKHILYIAKLVLKIDLESFANNVIKDYEKVSHSFKNIRVGANYLLDLQQKFAIDEERELTSDDLCAICFTDFMDTVKTNIVRCPQCRGILHSDCLMIWLKQGANKRCVYCRDKEIAKFLKI